jgi:riboflavin kinase/FMN adenylyltransferase
MTRVVTWETGRSVLPRSVVAIGVFDGVHIGHQALLAATTADAEARSASSAAITFDRDPDQVVTPDRAAPQLLTLADKLEFISECGMDIVLVVPFTPEVASLTPTSFLDSIVAATVDVTAIHVGADFRFGAGAAGDIATLRSWARDRGIGVAGEKLVTVDGKPVTSTRIRALVAEGDVEQAARLLGRPHRVTGTVGKGFPTANITPVDYAALPASGVYAGRAVLPDRTVWLAAISVGAPPSFPEATDALEVHVIGYEGDLYGEVVTVEFLRRLRDQRPFSSAADLAAAIGADVQLAASIGGDQV